MPLRVDRRPDTGTLWIVGTVRPANAPKGVRVRRRAGSDDARLAAEEAAALEAEILRSAWHGPRAAVRGFTQAALSYLKHQERSACTKALVRALSLHFRDAPLSAITQEAVDKAREALLRPGSGPATARRHVITPLRAILNHAAIRGWCEPPHFDLPAEPKGRTRFLLPDQVERLIAAAAPHLRPLLSFLVCTGCRLGEALELEWPAVDLTAARVILWEGETKSGERRVVALPPAAVAALAGLRHRDGHVFRPARKLPAARLTEAAQGYRSRDAGGGGQIRTAWSTACRLAGLPGIEGKQARPDRPRATRSFHPIHSPHALRHTWATWHYGLHHDLLRLAHDGGWASTALVERYAHLMPAGQEAAIRRVWGLAIVPARTADVA